MKQHPLLKLFFVNYVIFLTGMGLLPLLPLYAQDFGATATSIGFYMAVTYVAITAGSMLTGRLSEQLGHKNLFVATGILGLPGLLLLGQANAYWQLIVLTAVVWFVGGVGIAQVSVFTGMLARRDGRGKAFGLTFLALPLASVTAGIAIGSLTNWFGDSAVFTALALAWAGWPLIGLFGLEEKMIPAKVPGQDRDKGSRGRHGLGRAFYFLLAATLLSATTVYIARLGTSLSMQSLSFSRGAIAGTAAVGGLAMIPITLSFGSLSDKLGRRRFLALGYILGGIGALLLGLSVQLWQFWLATALIYAALSANGAVAPALASDLLTPEARNRGLPYLNAMRNVAGIIGFALGGIMIDALGAYGMYGIATLLALAAVPLLSQVRGAPEPQKPEMIPVLDLPPSPPPPEPVVCP